MHPFFNFGSACGSDGEGVLAMIKFFKTLRRDELGAAAAEYALILAVVGGGIAVAAAALGLSISAVMTRATAAMALVLP